MTSVRKRRNESSTSWRMRARLALRNTLPSFQSSPTFGGDADLVSHPGFSQCPSHWLFRVAEAVGRSGVDQCNSAVDR
jgi:hypothetical protein